MMSSSFKILVIFGIKITSTAAVLMQANDILLKLQDKVHK